MLEKALITAVNRRLPKTIHHQSMTGASRSSNGIPDRYYDASKRDLWVEYKMWDAVPRNQRVGGVAAGKRGYYSPLQYAWMERRYRNSLPHGRPNVVGIIGLPNRLAVIQTTPAEWREGSPVSLAVPLESVSAWIIEFCLQ